MEKEYVIQIAQTIQEQLIGLTPMPVLMSWGIAEFAATIFKDLPALRIVLFYPLRDKLYRRSPLAYGMIVSSFLERKLPRIIFSFHFPCSHQDSF